MLNINVVCIKSWHYIYLMKVYKKRDVPVHLIRRYLEPGPVVLVTSQHKEEINVMTMAWYTVMEFSPSLVGCMISSANHSYDLIRKSKECVINIPEAHLAKTVVDIGNCTGRSTDKFSELDLTPHKSSKVKAPYISECYGHIECKLIQTKLLHQYDFFIFEAVKCRMASAPKYPQTLHYTGEGIFMISGKTLNLKSRFKPQNL